MIPSQRLTIRMVHKSTTPELFKAICLWMVPASIQRCEQWTGVAKTLLTGWLFDIQDHSTVAAIYTWFKAIYKDPLLANQYNGMSQGFLNTHTHTYIYIYIELGERALTADSDIPNWKTHPNFGGSLSIFTYFFLTDTGKETCTWYILHTGVGLRDFLSKFRQSGLQIRKLDLHNPDFWLGPKGLHVRVPMFVTGKAGFHPENCLFDFIHVFPSDIFIEKLNIWLI